MSRPFCNQVIVITGVSRGIGREAALRFAAGGAVVAGIYASQDEAARELQATVHASGGELVLYKGSVSDADFVAAALSDLYSRFGRLDVLVNNAGRTADQLALLMEEPQWDEVLDTNFAGVAVCSQEAVGYMLRQREGSIVNVVSVSGIYGREAQSNYAASKGAVIGLTKLYARLYSRHGIRVSALAPGMISTGMAERVAERKVEEFLRHTAAERLGEAAEVAAAILYLAGSDAAYHAGQTLKLDGGFLR